MTALESKQLAEEPWLRIINVAVAAIGLVVTLPLFAIIALAIKLSCRGPVMYRQTRVGLDRRRAGVADGNHRRHHNIGGRPFQILKFRTMCEKSGSAQVWATAGDARVTKVGRILRKFRLDELPQLVNVLRGDMNVVGPRPEQPEIFFKLRESVPSYARRQRVRPGITGWAQIHRCYDRTIEDVKEKVRFDLEYIRRRSPLEDVRIMMRTLPVMFGGFGV
jgi:lipopolysaccharide/colanic/teichoic acid biosynthesis glycosyltransferase